MSTIIKKIEKSIEEKRPFYSFEYFPPKTEAGVHNLYARLDRMSTLDPLFMDVTWGAGGSTADLTLQISSNAQSFSSSEVMMHLTCTNQTKEQLREALEKAQKAGIRNILALRGDPPRGAESWEAVEGGFSHGVDLVKFIRAEFKDYFGIAVAGYPEGHTESKSPEDDLKYLKQKCDAGADFIVTQLFYDVELFAKWMQDCRKAGITCPIIPGIMPIQNYNGFKRMTGFCKTHIPANILKAIEPIKHDDARVKAYGIDLGAEMCRKLLALGCPGLHFYTLNLERSVTKILEALGYVTPKKSGGMPWMQSKISRRNGENVRPIFWANRPKSYLDRTNNWDEFPNGRWGDAKSPAFGDLTDYHLCSFKTGAKEVRAKLWGAAPTQPKDVFDVFCKYIDGKVSRLPWCETPVQLETIPIKKNLMNMNSCGFLTINSQPRVNGAPSTDTAVGWGGPGGYVYQKAYLEFFCSRFNLEKLTKLATSFGNITYTAVTAEGKMVTNTFSGKPHINAVTWGVFPNQQIVQPTVVSSDSFMVWKDEAFALWMSQWQSIYDEDSTSYKLIQNIHDTFYLVNVVDNDYINGDIWKFLNQVCNASASS